jgi:hypothetical protein
MQLLQFHFVHYQIGTTLLDVVQMKKNGHMVCSKSQSLFQDKMKNLVWNIADCTWSLVLLHKATQFTNALHFLRSSILRVCNT